MGSPSSSQQPSPEVAPLAARPGPTGRLVLLASVFVVASCGLVYELVAGAVSSYLLGNAVTQFSLVIGVFLCAMGAGSYLAKFITRNLLSAFVEIEIVIGLTGGASSLLMFAVGAFASSIFPVFFYSLCALLGILVGVEIPLLVRILKQDQGFSEAVSHVLALDYLGALVGAILFPLLVLPYLGMSRASIVFGLMNLAVAAAGIRLLPPPRRWISARLALCVVLLVGTFFFSTRLVGFFEDLLYQDDVIYAKDSAYQRIVLTRWRNDLRLYLNGHLQFSSVDEARYHEALVIPVMEAVGAAQDILILGGGDGLAAREVLKYKTVRSITLVDLDPTMTALARSRAELKALNGGSLDSPRLSIVHRDAMLFATEDEGFYDAIFVDLPDPSTESLAKLYSRSFYALVARRLSRGGYLVTQATSPYFAPEAFYCIVETVGQAMNDEADLGGLLATPYHVHVPSFGEWGFVMAGRERVDPNLLSPSVPVRFLNESTLRNMFSFSLDMQPPKGVRVNRLEDPVLFTYYRKGWRSFNE